MTQNRTGKNFGRLIFPCRLSKRRPCIYHLQSKKYVKLYLDDIVYIYKDNKNAVFILQNGQKETERKPLRNVYQNLNRKNMILLDRGIILNIHYVKAINGCDIELHNNIMLTTSKPHIEQLKRMLLALSS